MIGPSDGEMEIWRGARRSSRTRKIAAAFAAVILGTGAFGSARADTTGSGNVFSRHGSVQRQLHLLRVSRSLP